MVDRQPHCLKYGNTTLGYKETCLTCEEGYYVSSGVCTECEKAGTNCKVLDGAATSTLDGNKCICETCNDSYFL